LVSSSAEIFVVLLPVMLKCVAINLPMWRLSGCWVLTVSLCSSQVCSSTCTS
jgi:hypothetical protein